MPPRRKASAGLKAKKSAEDGLKGQENPEEAAADEETKVPQKRGRGRAAKEKVGKDQIADNKGDTQDEKKQAEPEKVTKKRGKKETDTAESDKPKKKAKDEQETNKKEKVVQEKVAIEKSDIKHAELPSKRYKIVSWNVTTIRSLMKKNPELLKKLMEQEQPDLICFQETKLKQEEHDEYEEMLKSQFPGDQGYEAHFSSSLSNKSYAGTLVLVRSSKDKATAQKQTKMDSFFKGKDSKSAKKDEETACPPLKVTFGLSTLSKDDGEIAAEVIQEGRTITVEFESFFVVATYVPNSGEKLQRLEFRTKLWDRKVVEYLKKLEASGKPVIWCGDLNVAHLDNDIWNVGAKHLVKSAGTTPEERDSFSKILEEGYVDCFRHLHGEDAKGWFSYWSVRAGNRPWNRGLRLDYFVASKSLCSQDSLPRVVDADIHDEFVAIDHAAISLTLAV
ncbi:apurinic/apyrimidinic endonuclease family member in base excision repair [Guillardia theta CCMP2712]|uniref:DNA-(apurinic or apyrimidinic site) endonuclease n=1 Tax=Guillardia theta (strain CCMP2712) TaxID=905079 RepID=L1JZE2_GUITC|nr:apurinic/apyrimidinic endonuclease family member in base excision repair [Guillardia theta CCMP2712]EKX53575.1 apurinic/apyrimidinic endonuclease family member in base excision repair [Guillardia theta CCMP2712]|eukprot:XP_005840555.1 apurinic/apyrimidinic endonuclease family member in base excision repair [Guillardia theta CCMP2712]